MPPCSDWITGEDVAACCQVETTASFEFDEVAGEASDLLFELSGRLYAGECGPKTVRPDCHDCLCGFQVLSRGHIVAPVWWDNLCYSCLVACDPSLVKLSGYPVRAISEVKIDGAVLAATEYRLHNSRYAMRLDNGRWPLRQNLTLPDTDDGTFSITYTYGADPPALGVKAAAQLACELYKQCEGQACALPIGVTRATRQGITIERPAFTAWAFRNGQWSTGMSLVDAFLTAYNPRGHLRRPVFYSPARRHRYAQVWG